MHLVATADISVGAGTLPSRGIVQPCRAIVRAALEGHPAAWRYWLPRTHARWDLLDDLEPVRAFDYMHSALESGAVSRPIRAADARTPQGGWPPVHPGSATCGDGTYELLQTTASGGWLHRASVVVV
jgi:hypothetical protein